jgi:predicted nucleic acid-binding protein
MSDLRGGGKLFLVDTSVFARAADSRVQAVLVGLISEATAARCVTVDLEAGYSARSAIGFEALMAERKKQYRNLPITEEIADRARDIQLRMAQRGQHRAAGIVDLLTAAVAEHHGATVLHYDSDFEHIAAVTGQAQLWVSPRGSLD